MMRVGSLFSGCGGFDLGFLQAGFRTMWGCEIDARARAVFRRHHPEAKIYHDIKEINGATLEAVDVLVFGSPCQDLSVAGKRAGLAGERSGLFMEAMRIVDQMAPENRPRVAVWENVPGALSSNGGKDFGSVLWEMGSRWSGIAYRVLDLQFFGPPQRRRRVFVVGHSGGWNRAAEILFEPQGLRWNPPPRKKAGQGITQALTRSLGAGGPDDNRAQGGFYVAATLKGGPGERGWSADDCASLAIACYGGNNTGGGIDVATCLNACKTSSGRIDFESETFVTHETGQGWWKQSDEEASYCLCNPASGGRTHSRQIITPQSQVRRLTPTECERLMGWPDGYTAWGLDDDGATVEMSDSARYRMIGNGVGAPVAEWMAKRIREGGNP
jgi:DNA (cytosine-5)-methyltransferase 1